MAGGLESKTCFEAEGLSTLCFLRTLCSSKPLSGLRLTVDCFGAVVTSTESLVNVIENGFFLMVRDFLSLLVGSAVAFTESWFFPTVFKLFGTFDIDVFVVFESMYISRGSAGSPSDISSL